MAAEIEEDKYKYYAFTEETLLAHDKEIVKKTKEAIDHILSGYLKIEDVMLATNEDINALFTTTA